MLPTEYNYRIYDKEMLVIIQSLKQWRPKLASTRHSTEIYSDHKALEYFMTSKELTARYARWCEALSEYNFRIMYHKGKDNGKADTLTRRDYNITA